MDYRTALREEVVGPLRFQISCLENFEKAVDTLYETLLAKGEGAKLDSLCPYFGVLWPGARVLASWIWQQGPSAFLRKSTLELGCGLALPSFVAARLGADPLATDSHPDVPLFLAKNLSLNPGHPISYRYLDWRFPPPTLTSFDWVFASDILYEPHQVSSLVHFLKQVLAASGQAVILDPDRSYWNRLLEEAARVGLRCEVETLEGKSPEEPTRSLLIRISQHRATLDSCHRSLVV